MLVVVGRIEKPMLLIVPFVPARKIAPGPIVISPVSATS
jgi:hypothetical protein